MVAYFRKQNILFILLGGMLGAAVWFARNGLQTPGIFGLILLLVSILGGMLIGRIVSAVWAGKQLQKYNALLFTNSDPEKFLEVFTPIVENVPKTTVEYIDGCNKLAYAWEALGDFEKAQSYLEPLEPEKLKRNSLDAVVTVTSNLIRVLLLQEKTEQAEILLERLRRAADDAMVKSVSLGKSAMNCVRLYENWLLVLAGERADEEYLEKEVDRALNRIRKSELQLLLAKAYENIGETELADELRMDAMTDGIGLWTGAKARELLSVSVD